MTGANLIYDVRNSSLSHHLVRHHSPVNGTQLSFHLFYVSTAIGKLTEVLRGRADADVVDYSDSIACRYQIIHLQINQLSVTHSMTGMYGTSLKIWEN